MPLAQTGDGMILQGGGVCAGFARPPSRPAFRPADDMQRPVGRGEQIHRFPARDSAGDHTPLFLPAPGEAPLPVHVVLAGDGVSGEDPVAGSHDPALMAAPGIASVTRGCVRGHDLQRRHARSILRLCRHRDRHSEDQGADGDHERGAIVRRETVRTVPSVRRPAGQHELVHLEDWGDELGLFAPAEMNILPGEWSRRSASRRVARPHQLPPNALMSPTAAFSLRDCRSMELRSAANAAA